MLRTNSAGVREKIIEATQKVVIREGIWNATTRKIAAEASITLASIHYHFASKEVLLFAVFEQMLDNIRGAAREHFILPSTLAERISHSLQMTWEYSEQHCPEQFLLTELTLYAMRTEGAEWLARRQIDDFIAFYLGIFSGASDLRGQGELDLTGLTRTIVAGVDGILLQHYAHPDPARSAGAIRKLIEISMHYPLSDTKPPLTPLTLSTMSVQKEM